MGKINIVTDPNFVGDRSNLLGIANETQLQLTQLGSEYEISEYNIQALEILAKEIKSSKKKHILISAGTYGIEAIKRLKSDQNIANRILAIHVFHQIINSEKEGQFSILKTKIQDGADIIALPSHVLNPKIQENFEESGTRLIQTIGVAHKTTKIDIHKAFAEYQKILPKSDKYLGIILPGDAPDSSGEMLYFTPDNVEALIDNILKNYSNYTLLISNGPRTGKHNSQTGEILKNHIDNIMDPVTKQFINSLDQKKVKYKLFDFQKGMQNYKNLIFGTIAHNRNNIILIPGESTSLISEAVDLIPNDQIIIYENEAMNDNHKKHVASEFKSGRGSIMKGHGQITLAKASDKEILPTKVLISEEIIKQLRGE